MINQPPKASKPNEDHGGERAADAVPQLDVGLSEAASPAAVAAFVAAQHDVNGAPVETLRAAWRGALTAALDAGDVQLARAAGQQVQLLAADAGDLAEIASVAERVAALAARAGDLDALVYARCEAALSAAQRGERVDVDALHAFVFDDAVGPRTKLRTLRVVGELCLLLGDLPRARARLAEVLARGHAFGDGSVDAELAHAAYLLGTLCVHEQPQQGLDALMLTVALARKLAQWPLYTAAIHALERALPGDDELLVRLVKDARDELPAAGWARLGALVGTARLDALLAR